MFEILICDDDRAVTDELRGLLGEYAGRTGEALHITALTSAGDAIDGNLSCDIAIVDIEMPGTDGLQHTEYLQAKNADVLVLVLTSYMKYLDSAMRVNVFRYLSKPVEKERLFRNLSEAVARCRELGRTVAVKSGGEIVRVRTNDILYIENLKSGSVVVTKTARYQTSKKPEEWRREIGLPDRFVFSHKSFLVNLQNVTRIGRGGVVFLTPEGEKSFPIVSQRRFRALREAFFAFLGGSR